MLGFFCFLWCSKLYPSFQRLLPFSVAPTVMCAPPDSVSFESSLSIQFYGTTEKEGERKMLLLSTTSSSFEKVLLLLTKLRDLGQYAKHKV
jgi:hypothetical protein